ncbi:hypothetical protein RYX36_016965 [Vicia faba]
MAKSKNNAKKLSYIYVPSQMINSISSSSLQSLIHSPKKSSTTIFFTRKSSFWWFLTLFLVAFLGMFKFGFKTDTPFPHKPCSTTHQKLSVSNHHSKSKLGISSVLLKKERTGLKNDHKDEFFVSHVELGAKGSSGIEKKSEFWKKPNGLGYKPCLSFSSDYRRQSERILKERRKYLMVVVSGGLNQQRNQIVDAVVIARILGASLIVPILQVNVIWGDESEFGDIFDLEHFKKVLGNDVRVVSALPSTHLMTRLMERRPPFHATPSWIRSRYLRRLSREGVLLLRGLDSRLSKDLPSDLQKLRCKVAFNALRFAEPIEKVGNKIAERMKSKGPYLALHLRMEKDVWVRTGCLPGLSPEYDEIVNNERIQRPELLTARSNMSYLQRKMAGFCPLNAMEVTRLLKALGAPKDAKIYWAGGKPLGGRAALLPLIQEFPNFYNKEDLAFPAELQPFVKKASLMAAIDYIVSEKSDVFMPSHGGNMGHAIQGYRAFSGHKKFITPNKRHMLPYFLNSSLSEEEFNRIIKELHRDSLGQPVHRTNKGGRDVTKYPVPECMCNHSHSQS